MKGPTIPLFNRLMRTPLPQINRKVINIDANDENYDALKVCKGKYPKGNDTHKDSLSFPIGSTVAVQHEDGGSWMHRVVREMNSTDHN